jgi:hypothetical protein
VRIDSRMIKDERVKAKAGEKVTVFDPDREADKLG